MPGNLSPLPATPFEDTPTSFVVDFDLAGLIASLGIDCGTAEDQEAVLAAEREALSAATEPPVEVPGRVAALLPTGAGLAAWLASAGIGQCSDAELPDLALGYRRLAAWAQAQELSAVAEIASRTAILRDRADDAGKPASRPRPHHPLALRRPHLRLQPQRPLPHPSQDQAAAWLETRATPAWRPPLDDPSRAHHTRQPNRYLM